MYILCPSLVPVPQHRFPHFPSVLKYRGWMKSPWTMREIFNSNIRFRSSPVALMIDWFIYSSTFMRMCFKVVNVNLSMFWKLGKITFDLLSMLIFRAMTSLAFSPNKPINWSQAWEKKTIPEAMRPCLSVALPRDRSYSLTMGVTSAEVGHLSWAKCIKNTE